MPTRFLNLPTFISLPRNCAFQTYQGTGESSYTLRVTVNNSAMEEGTLFLTNFWLFQDTLGIIIMYYILLNKKWLYSPISNALVGPCMSSVLSRVWLLATPFCAPGSSIHGILQARILEWVAIFYSKGSSRPRDLICAPPGSPALAGGFFTTAPPGKSLSKPKCGQPKLKQITGIFFLLTCCDKMARKIMKHPTLQWCDVCQWKSIREWNMCFHWVSL